MSNLQQAVTDYLKSIKRLTPRTQKGYAQRLLVFADYCKEQGIELGSITTVALRKGGIVPGIFLGKFPGTTSTSCVSRFDVPC